MFVQSYVRAFSHEVREHLTVSQSVNEKMLVKISTNPVFKQGIKNMKSLLAKEIIPKFVPPFGNEGRNYKSCERMFSVPSHTGD